MKIRAAAPTSHFVLILALGFLVTLALLPSSASAASMVGKDGKIHACYKWKGKGKGDLRVVRNAKVRCPRKWKKVSWQARGISGRPIGVPGPAGPAGPQGEKGTAGNLVVEDLEDKVSELLTRVEQLEALVPTVQSLCAQVTTLTKQVNSVEQVLAGLKLNVVLTTLGGILEIPTLPGSLEPFDCATP